MSLYWQLQRPGRNQAAEDRDQRRNSPGNSDRIALKRHPPQAISDTFLSAISTSAAFNAFPVQLEDALISAKALILVSCSRYSYRIN